MGGEAGVEISEIGHGRDVIVNAAEAAFRDFDPPNAGV